MKRLTVTQKVEALNNALQHYSFPEKYFIQQADGRIGHKFAIASKPEERSLHIHTSYMTYEEMNSFFIGYSQATRNPLK